MGKRLLSFLFFSAVVVAFGWSLSALFRWIGSTNPTVEGAAITAFLGLLGLWYTQWQSKSRDIRENHRSKKVEVYGTFFDLVEQFQKQTDTSSSTSVILTPELKDQFLRLNRGLLLWASPSVIRAYLAFRIQSQLEDKSKILFAVDTMYREIRKDLETVILVFTRVI